MCADAPKALVHNISGFLLNKNLKVFFRLFSFLMPLTLQEMNVRASSIRIRSPKLYSPRSVRVDTEEVSPEKELETLTGGRGGQFVSLRGTLCSLREQQQLPFWCHLADSG